MRVASSRSGTPAGRAVFAARFPLPGAPRRPAELSAAERKPLARLFAVFDTDASGEISAVELRDGLRALGLRPANNDVLAMIRQVDLKRGAERDGCIDEEEVRSERCDFSLV